MLILIDQLRNEDLDKIIFDFVLCANPLAPVSNEQKHRDSISDERWQDENQDTAIVDFRKNATQETTLFTTVVLASKPTAALSNFGWSWGQEKVVQS